MADDFDESLDRLYCDLTDRSPAWAEFAWPKERAFIDCYEASGGLGGGGLYSFWSADHPQRRIIRSFKSVGAHRIADLLAESAWAKNLIETGDYDNRENEFGADRFAEFTAIERKIFDEMEGLIPLLRSFVDQHHIEAKPLNAFGRLLATTTYPFRVIIPAFIEGVREERRSPSVDPDSLPIFPEDAITAGEAKICFGWVDDGWIHMELNFPVRYSNIEGLESDDGSSSMHFEWYVFPERSIADLAGRSFDEEALSEHSIYDRGELKVGGRRIDCDIHRISFTQVDEDHFDLSLSAFCWFYFDELAQNATIDLTTKATITTEQPEG